MKVELHVLPRETMTREQFISETPSPSIALDGFVPTAPFFENGTHVNFDHHHDVNRLSTRATCAQVYLAIRQGLFEAWREKYDTVHVWVNDADHDVSLAVWLLRNYHRFETSISTPLLERLVHVGDVMDATGGTYKVDMNAPIMGERAWIFEPYTRVRQEGSLFTMTSAAMEAVIDSVGDRITQYSIGRVESAPIDTDYTVLRTEENYIFVNEVGFEARYAIISAGNTAFVSVLAQPAEGRWAYTIARTSEFIPTFDLPSLFGRLNDAENEVREANGLEALPEGQGWGGSTLIGGSPRAEGSMLDFDALASILNE